MRFTIQQIGIGIGLVSIALFFAALILAYGIVIRGNFQTSYHAPEILWISTSVLALSSLTLESARKSLRRALPLLYRGRLNLTVLFAFLFFGAQAMAAYQLFTQGITVQSNPRGSVYYVFMALHGAHLVGGLCWLIYLRVVSSRLFVGTETDLRNQRRLTSAAALYWHFMGILWIVLFVFLQLWSH